MGGWPKRVGALALVVAKLPVAALAGHEDELTRVAQDRVLRVYAWRALTRLSAFGDSGAATLLWLVEDAGKERAQQGGYGWQNAYLAGMTGLCTLGQDGAVARDRLVALAEKRVVSVGSGVGWNLAISTFVRLGLSPEEIIDLARRSGQTLQTDQFNIGLSQAASANPCGD